MSKKKISKKSITESFDSDQLVVDLYGPEDGHLRLLEKDLGVEICARGTEVKISGEAASIEAAQKVLKELYLLLKRDTRL